MGKRRGSPHPPAQIKRAVILRDGGVCLIALSSCSGMAETVHHRANRGSGGSRVLNHPSNLVAACVRCNGDAEDADQIPRMDLVERGVRVEKDSTNDKTLLRAQLTPVLYPDGEKYYLVDASTRVHEHDFVPF